MIKIKYFILATLLFILPLLTLAGCGGDALGAKYKPGTPTSYVTLNFNPSVELIADHKNKVIAINAINDEAGLLFFNKDYRGYQVDVVIREMVNVMAQTGYISAETEETSEAVFVSVFSTTTATQNDVQAKIKATVDSYFAKNGLYAVVLETQFDNKITTEAQKSGLSSDVPRFRAILKAMEYDIDAEFKEVRDMNSTKLLNKLYNEIIDISQIKTKAQKDAYLNTRLSLKENFDNSLVEVYGNSLYTQLYNELKALEEEYRTTTDISYANETLKPLILEKIEEMQNMESDIRNNASTTAINSLKAQYNSDIGSLLSLNAQLSQENAPNYAEILLQKKSEFLANFEVRKNYAKYNAYLWQTEYETWKPNTAEKLSEFMSVISSKVSSLKSSTRTDVTRALNRINPYTRSQFFGDSGGGTWILS